MYRLISYNVHSGIGRDGKRDYSRIGQFLVAQNADIVFLQEMDTRDANSDTNLDISAICGKDHFSMLPAPTFQTEHGWFGNAILTRFPVVHTHQYDISYGTREPRTFQQAIISIDGVKLALFNAHLGLRRKERMHQIGKIKTIISRMHRLFQIPACMGGDMNEWFPKTQLFDAFKDHYRQHHTGFTFPSHFPMCRLDRLWSCSQIQDIKSARIDDKTTAHYSDHLPIKLDFTIENT